MLTRALTNMKSFLKKGEDWAKENNVPVQKLLDGKLAEDMKVGTILEHQRSRHLHTSGVF